VTGLLVTSRFYERNAAELARLAGIETFVLSNERGTTLDPELRERVDIAFLSGDLYPGNFRGFFESLVDCPNLKWVHVFYVGVEGPLWAPLFDKGVTLTNSAGASGRYIAQSAITALLMLSRPFLAWGEAQRRHEWRQITSSEPLAPTDLSDETIVVVGLGAIGAEIARLAKALGLRVVGVRRSEGSEPFADAIVHPSQLDSHLPSANWLALACPLTDETRGLIDARRLSMLPAGARVLNVSRGAVIDEDALVRELQNRHVGGAYLDVFAREPLPPDSPLWDLPNVIVTPHNSGVSSTREAREADLFFENLRRWLGGDDLLNRVRSLGFVPA